MHYSNRLLLARRVTNLTHLAKNSGHLQNVNVEGDKLFVEAEVANDDVTSKILNEIEKIDPRYSDLTLDVTINPAMPAPAAGGHGRVGFGRKLAEAYGTTGCFAGAEHGIEVA